MKDGELRDMAEHFELPLKEGAWDIINARIPVYPTKKRWRVYWPFLFLTIISIGFLSFIFLSKQASEKTGNLQASTKNSITTNINDVKSEPLSANRNSPQTKFSNPIQAAELLPENNEAVETGINASSNFSSSIKRTNASKTLSVYKQFSKSKTSKIESALTSSLNSSTQAFEDAEQDKGSSIFNTFQAHKLRAFNGFEIPWKMDFSDRLNIKDHRPLRNRISPFKKYFVSLSYGVLNSNIHLEPELMKLPKGEGKEFNFYIGRNISRWELSIGTHFARIHQNTSMGNHHDTTYYQVFKPGFETVLPSEYAGRLHDTSHLYIAGTNHNTVHQEFDILGLSFNVGRVVFSRDKFYLQLNYGANYKLLKRANTFFYDSINKAAVPFSQKDKGIVYRNLMSSRMSLAFNYQLSNRFSLELSPFADVFHSPFIKHYYRAGLRNYGMSFGLRFRF